MRFAAPLAKVNAKETNRLQVVIQADDCGDREKDMTRENFDEALACSEELLPWILATFKRVSPMVDYLCAAQELEF